MEDQQIYYEQTVLPIHETRLCNTWENKQTPKTPNLHLRL